MAQNAIEMAEKGDYSEVQRVLKMLETPFDENVDHIDAGKMINYDSHRSQSFS